MSGDIEGKNTNKYDMKGIRIIALSVVSIIVLAVASILFIWRGELRTVATIEQLDDQGYLYCMEYKAHYDLDKLVESDVDQNGELMSYLIHTLSKGLVDSLDIESSQVVEKGEEGRETFGCTSFQAANSNGNGFIYGRNYDFFKNPTMVTISHPEKGYASIAVSDMSQFGYSLEHLPKSFAQKVLSLAAIYAPMDGINEKGLCTSIMALPNQPSQQNFPGRHYVGTSIIMRLFLDRCATVEEALELLLTVNVNHDVKMGSGFHYMVADALGKCAIIEFDKDDQWKTIVIQKSDTLNHMVITNHLLNPKHYSAVPDPVIGNVSSFSWDRYERVSAFMNEHNGTLNIQQAQECLALVRWVDLLWPNGEVEDTQFSDVYDQKELKLYLRNWNNYDHTYEFSLE